MTPQAAILLTVAYSAQFSYPLRARELWLRLLSDSKTDLLPNDFILALVHLVADRRLGYHDGFIFLSRRKSDIASRLASETRADRKREELQVALRFCAIVPWIVGVAVTGSIAMRQARRSDDLDFFVVTKPHRLWLSRALLICLSSIFGKYRSRTNRHSSGWCFNLWLESTSLTLPPHKHGVYSAFEVLQADWVYDLSQIERQFLLANSWVGRVIPRLFKQRFAQLRNLKSRELLSSFFVVDFILRCCNFLAYLTQRLYMRAVITREIVQPNAAYFHPRNTQGNIGDRWRSILESIV